MKSKTPRMSPGHLEETSDLLRDESLNLYIKDVGDDYLNSFHPSSDQKGGEQIPTSKQEISFQNDANQFQSFRNNVIEEVSSHQEDSTPDKFWPKKTPEDIPTLSL